MSTKIGEVIEASTSEFVAQCYELYASPPLGGLVRTSDGEVAIYGVVCHVATESIDPGRRPLARGREEAEEGDIYRKNPQLSKLLRTLFRACIVGQGQGDGFSHHLPSRPARVHSFVYLCQGEEVGGFTRSLDFLSLLLDQGEEVVGAFLRGAASAHEDSRAFLVAAGKELALLLGGDLGRLNALLKRIRP